MNSCEHIDAIRDNLPYPKSQFTKFECQECVKTGDNWVHLRICQTCGSMLCCDASKNQHSRKHWEKTGHPVIISAEMGDTWIYCYKDDVML